MSKRPESPKPDEADAFQKMMDARKVMFDRWIDECTMMQEAFIEGLLAQVEIARDG